MHRLMPFTFTALLVAGVALAQTPPSPPAGTPPQPVYKAKSGTYANVQEIFNARCIFCHGERPRGRIDLRTYESIMKGGEDGLIVKPKDLKHSVLVQALHGAPGYRAMPPRNGPLPEKEIKSIETWIKKGAKSK